MAGVGHGDWLGPVGQALARRRVGAAVQAREVAVARELPRHEQDEDHVVLITIDRPAGIGGGPPVGNLYNVQSERLLRTR